MSTKLNKEGYEWLIEDNISHIEKSNIPKFVQEHIKLVLRESVNSYYPNAQSRLQHTLDHKVVAHECIKHDDSSVLHYNPVESQKYKEIRPLVYKTNKMSKNV